MKSLFCRLVVLLVSGAALAVSAAPKFYNPVPDKEAKVAATGKWQVASAGGESNLANTPAGMLIARLGNKKHLYRWAPSENRRSISGEADITDVLISQDESMLLFIEKVGGDGKPNSTRFVYLNLINGKICGGFTLHGRRLSCAAFVPDRNNCIIALQQGQKEFNNHDALVMIDLKKEQLTAESTPIASGAFALVCDGSRAWFACKNSPVIREADIYDLKSAFRTVNGKKPIRGLALSSDGKMLQVLEEGWCEFFDITSKGAIFSDSVELPARFAADWVLAVPPDNRSVVAAAKNGAAYYISGGEAREISRRSGAFGCILPANGHLLLGQAVRGRISRLVLPECRELLRINPGELRPVNRNDTLRLFGRTGKGMEAIQVDVRGNVFRLLITDRRGSKRPLLLVDKRGVR